MNLKRLLFTLVFLVCIGTTLAATNIFDIADLFVKKYRIEPGETAISTVARTLYESPSTDGKIQVYDPDSKTFRSITNTDIFGTTGAVSLSGTTTVSPAGALILSGTTVAATAKQILVTGSTMKIYLTGTTGIIVSGTGNSTF